MIAPVNYPFFIFWLLYIFVGFIAIPLAIRVYQDANRKYIKSPGLWAFITLIGNVVGLIIYLIVRSKKNAKGVYIDNFINPNNQEIPQVVRKYCSLCKLVQANDNEYCPKCGVKLIAHENLPPVDVCCPNCSNIKTEEGNFCVKCGAKYQVVCVDNHSNSSEVKSYIDKNNVRLSQPLKKKRKTPIWQAVLLAYYLWSPLIFLTFSSIYINSESAHKRTITHYCEYLYSGSYEQARSYLRNAVFSDIFFTNQKSYMENFLYTNDVKLQGVRIQRVNGRSNLPTYQVRAELLVNGERILTDANYLSVEGNLGISSIYINTTTERYKDWKGEAKNNIDITDIRICESVMPKQYIIMFNLHNTTDNDYRIGWVNQGDLIIRISDIDDDKTYTYTTSMHQGLTLKKQSTNFLTYTIDNVTVDLLDNSTGDLNLTITNLIKLNDNGLPVNNDTIGFAYSINLLK